MFYYVLVSFFFWVSSLSLSSDLTAHWEKLYVKDGIEVFKAKVSGSKFVAFKGTIQLDASPQFIIDIFKDQSRWQEWTKRLITGKILAPLQESSMVFYQAFESPPLIKNRDAVYQVSFEGPGKTGSYSITGISVQHPQSPPTIGVRMHIQFSKWVLTPLQDKTKVQLEMLADPGGLIPSWVVNFVQRKYPYDILNALRKHVARLFREKAMPNR